MISCLRHILGVPQGDTWDAEAHAALMVYAGLEVPFGSATAADRALDVLRQREYYGPFKECVQGEDVWLAARAMVIHAEIAEVQRHPVAIEDVGSERSKVVHGTTLPYISIPEQNSNAIGAFLGGSGFPTCTGTLIYPRVVLSAAHCTGVGRGTTFAVGENSAAPVATAKVLATAVHPSYSAPPGHDFMLAYLDDDLPAEPIPIGTAPPNGAGIQAVGYGWTSASQSDENTSRWWVYEPVVRVSQSSFTVDGQGRHGLCLGDSGGPALIPGPYLVGTLSAGSGTCVGSDVFAIPAVDADWIEQQIGLWHSNPPATLGKFPWSLVLGGAAVIGIGAFLRKS